MEFPPSIPIRILPLALSYGTFPFEFLPETIFPTGFVTLEFLHFFCLGSPIGSLLLKFVLSSSFIVKLLLALSIGPFPLEFTLKVFSTGVLPFVFSLFLPLDVLLWIFSSTIFPVECPCGSFPLEVCHCKARIGGFPLELSLWIFSHWKGLLKRKISNCQQVHFYAFPPLDLSSFYLLIFQYVWPSIFQHVKPLRFKDVQPLRVVQPLGFKNDLKPKRVKQFRPLRC